MSGFKATLYKPAASKSCADGRGEIAKIANEMNLLADFSVNRCWAESKFSNVQADSRLRNKEVKLASMYLPAVAKVAPIKTII